MRSTCAAEMLENRRLLSASGFVGHRFDRAPHSSGDFVYIETNNPNSGQNAVLAFRQTDGGLQQIGGPYLTGGTGQINPTNALGPDDSDKEVIASSDGRLLFAVNQGSDSIAVFRIHHDGSLRLVPGGPFSSGGTQPVSLTISGDRLFVANRGDEIAGQPGTVAPNYTGFRIGENGRLTPIAGSTVTLPVGLSPAQILASQSGDLLFGDNFTPPPLLNVALSNTIEPFNVDSAGHLTVATGGAVASQATPSLILGLAENPTQRIVYAGLPAAGGLDVFTYDSNGALHLAGTVGSSGKGTCWVTVSADGKRLYTSDSGTDSVGVYSLANPLKPVEIQEFSLNGPKAAVGASGNETVDFQLALDPSGNSLYVVNHDVAPNNDFASGNQLHVLSVAPDGTLSESSDSPTLFADSEIPANAHIQGVAVIDNPGGAHHRFADLFSRG